MKCAEPPCSQVSHQTVNKLRKVLVEVGFKADSLAVGGRLGTWESADSVFSHIIAVSGSQGRQAGAHHNRAQLAV
jgi:hypothetical protein